MNRRMGSDPHGFSSTITIPGYFEVEFLASKNPSPQVMCSCKDKSQD